MNLNESLLLISPLVFGVLGILSAVNFVRRPDRIRRDAALMLNSLAISLALSTLIFAFSSRNPILEVIVSILLLAHLYFLLREIPAAFRGRVWGCWSRKTQLNFIREPSISKARSALARP